jgi:hypothetical protein
VSPELNGFGSLWKCGNCGLRSSAERKIVYEAKLE